jgi:CelD/BcsL family acetyltransferase involved in cellulose biosynthesis
MLEVSVVSREEELAGLRERWEALLNAAREASPFLSWEWMTCWWQAYGQGKTLLLLLVSRGGELVGLAPLYSESVSRYGLFRYRVVRFLGDGSNDSDYLDLLSRSGEEQAVAEAVADFLKRRSVPWDLLWLNEMPAGTPHLPALLGCLDTGRAYVETTEVPCCLITLPRSWEAYERLLRPRDRTKLRSLSRNLTESHQVEFSRVRLPEELPAILESLFELHARRWRLKNQSGVFTGPGKRRFYDLMSRAFLERGWLFLYTLAVEGRWVAHQFCFAWNRRVYLLQEGFDPDWGEAGVGNVLRAHTIQDFIQRGFLVYDFLAGVTPHKLSWGATPTRSLRLTVGSRRLKNHVYFLLPRVRAGLQRAAEKHLPSALVKGLRKLKRGLRGGAPPERRAP